MQWARTGAFTSIDAIESFFDSLLKLLDVWLSVLFESYNLRKLTASTRSLAVFHRPFWLFMIKYETGVSKSEMCVVCWGISCESLWRASSSFT